MIVVNIGKPEEAEVSIAHITHIGYRTVSKKGAPIYLSGGTMVHCEETKEQVLAAIERVSEGFDSTRAALNSEL